MRTPASGTKNKPVLVHTHGCGYVLANTFLYPFIQTIAHDCHCVVVSVDYRMAPDTHYPSSVDDNYVALRWVYANAASIDRDRNSCLPGGYHAFDLLIPNAAVSRRFTESWMSALRRAFGTT